MRQALRTVAEQRRPVPLRRSAADHSQRTSKMKKTLTAAAKVEDLIENLKTSYTVVIVTHNMQQAARVSGYTAFMMLGELGEANKLTEDYITGRFG